MTEASGGMDHDERWREWQSGNARASRRSAIQVRLAFTAVSVLVVGWLVIQLMAR
jgi:hypothetical protein